MTPTKKAPTRASTKRVIKDKTGSTYSMLIVVQGVTINRKPLPADVAVEMIADGVEQLVGGLVIADIKRRRNKKK